MLSMSETNSKSVIFFRSPEIYGQKRCWICLSLGLFPCTQFAVHATLFKAIIEHVWSYWTCWTQPRTKLIFLHNFILIWKYQKWSLNRVPLHQQQPFTKQSAFLQFQVPFLYSFRCYPMILDYSLQKVISCKRQSHS